MQLTALFILFGWPKKTKSLGVVAPMNCPHCANTEYTILYKVRQWATLFFIPILPLSRKQYFLTCGVCGDAVEITDSDEVERCVEMTGVTQQYFDYELSADRYAQEVRQFLNGSDAVTEIEELGAEQLPEERGGVSVECAKCDSEVSPDVDYCPDCGADLKIKIAE